MVAAQVSGGSIVTKQTEAQAEAVGRRLAALVRQALLIALAQKEAEDAPGRHEPRRGRDIPRSQRIEVLLSAATDGLKP
jgi:hypothetical protein